MIIAGRKKIAENLASNAHPKRNPDADNLDLVKTLSFFGMIKNNDNNTKSIIKGSSKRFRNGQNAGISPKVASEIRANFLLLYNLSDNLYTRIAIGMIYDTATSLGIKNNKSNCEFIS